MIFASLLKVRASLASKQRAAFAETPTANSSETITMEILNVVKTSAPPVPPVEITYIDVRLTQKEATFIGTILGGLPRTTAEACGGTAVMAERLWRQLRNTLGVTSFGSPWLVVSKTPGVQLNDEVASLRAKVAALEDTITKKDELLQRYCQSHTKLADERDKLQDKIAAARDNLKHVASNLA
jgi:hypothetical protein